MKTKTESLPLFCQKCCHAKKTLLSGRLYCKQSCKFNPVSRYSAFRSFFKKKWTIASAY